MDASQTLAYFEACAGYKCTIAVIYRIDATDAAGKVCNRYYGSHYKDKLALANINRLQDHTSATSCTPLQHLVRVLTPEQIKYWLVGVVLLPVTAVGATYTYNDVQGKDHAHIFIKRMVEQHYINDLTERAARGGPLKLNCRDEIKGIKDAEIMGVVSKVQLEGVPFFAVCNYKHCGSPDLAKPCFRAVDLWHVNPKGTSLVVMPAHSHSTLSLIMGLYSQLAQQQQQQQQQQPSVAAGNGVVGPQQPCAHHAVVQQQQEQQEQQRQQQQQQSWLLPRPPVAWPAVGADATAQPVALSQDADVAPPRDAVPDSGVACSAASNDRFAQHQFILYHLFVSNGSVTRDAQGQPAYLRMNFRYPSRFSTIGSQNNGSAIRNLAYHVNDKGTYPYYIDRFDLQKRREFPGKFSDRRHSLARFTPRGEAVVQSLVHNEAFQAEYARWIQEKDKGR
jgi:hypothetical protein